MKPLLVKANMHLGLMQAKVAEEFAKLRIHSLPRTTSLEAQDTTTLHRAELRELL